MRALTLQEEVARHGWSVRHASVPGRLRLFLPELQRAPEVKAALETHLPQVPGIAAASASVWSGSLLIRHDTVASLDAILSAVAKVVRSLRRTTRGAPSKRRESGASAPPPEVETAWHAVPASDVADHFGTDTTEGLSASTVAAHRECYGRNALETVAGPSTLAQVLAQFNSLPVMLLLGSAGISIATGGLADAAAIVAIVGVNAVIGFLTERQAERTISALARPSRSLVRVRRDGVRDKVPEEDLVPGDLIEIRPGEYVPADARLISVESLTVDESSLTGESVAVAKSAAIPAKGKVPLAERRNLVFKGTVATAGRGAAIVTGTGMATEIGRIQAMTDTAQTPTTRSQVQLDRLGKQLVVVSGAVCVGVFGAGLLHGFGLLPMLKSSIALAVAAVPEGLPAMAVTTLALGIRDMRRYGVLIRRLPAVETLGSLQTICLDKTGTLTHNRMTVAEVRTRRDTVRLSDGQFEGAAGQPDAEADGVLLRLLEVGVLCSDAKSKTRNGSKELQGSATEVALVRGASAAGIRMKDLRKATPLVRVEHRRDGANYMRSRHRTAAGGTLIAMKGAPLEVLDFCDRYLTSDGPRDMNEDDRRAIAAANADMAGAGQRVLGFACAWHDEPPEAAPDGHGALIWLGLAGLADPIREGIKEVVAHFHQAGIATVMLTGDQRETAAAIARDLDLGGGAPITVVDAHDLEDPDADDLGHTVERAQVFARVTPRNKLDVVRALQQRGQVVAMTGDGINDSPALKAADVGIAMGRSGTPVARDVADVVLRDDNLDDMVTGIHRGRTIYRNIRKSMRFLLSTNASEILVMFAATAAGRPAPLTAMQLLWINLATDVFPAIGLALEPPDADIMRAPPRDPDEPIVRRQDLWRIGRESLLIGAGSLGGYAWGLARYGPGPQAQTVGCLGLIGGQLLHAVTCRSHRSIFARSPGWRRRNLYLDAGLAGTAGLQVLVASVPALRNFFGFAPLGPAGYGVAIVAGVVPFLVNNVLKGHETAPDWAPERTPRRSAALGSAATAPTPSF